MIYETQKHHIPLADVAYTTKAGSKRKALTVHLVSGDTVTMAYDEVAGFLKAWRRFTNKRDAWTMKKAKKIKGVFFMPND